MTSSLDSDSRKMRYLCQRCGNCCRWPGDVRVTDAEIGAIAAYLGLDTTVFIERYTRLNANRTGLSLTDKANGECVFLQDLNVCQIQQVKPAQCKGFPNEWRFPGWREQCEAIDLEPGTPEPDAAVSRAGDDFSSDRAG